MPNQIYDQLEIDPKLHLERVRQKISEFPSALTPIPKEVGMAYMKAYQKTHPIPFAFKISKEELAFLYKYVLENNLDGCAIGLGKYDKNELGAISDPNWNERRANQNTIVMGMWNQTANIAPMKIDDFEFYFDWHNEEP